jgi:hypothetical protein
MTFASIARIIAPDLDQWLPDPQIRTRYSRAASAAPIELWHAAETIRVRDAPRLGRVLRWRIPGTPAAIPYREVFRRYPFTVLEEGEGWSVSGLAGKPWSLRRDYPELAGADDVRDWDDSGTVRILFAHWVSDGEGESAEIVSESRVEPVDRSARWRMRALWSAVGRVEGLIGRVAHDAAV